MENPYSLEGKTILVTGASSGIGQAIGIWCSKMSANVILTGRNEEKLNATCSHVVDGKYQAIVADLTNSNELDRLVAQLPELDGVVLCAGQGSSMPIKSANRAKFDSVFNINFFSQVELLRLLYKNKRLKKAASIVIIDSIGGLNVFSTGNAIYGTSKAALNSYMKYAANEFSMKKIRVNSICPGMIETPLIHHGGYSDEQLKQNESSYPLGRFGKPDDVAYAAIYLLSDASSWVTGTSMIVDGGRSIK